MIPGTWKINFPSFLLIFALFLLPCPSLAGQYEVYRVVNGDTFIVKQGSVKLTIRLIGIDAPEMSTRLHQLGQPFSLEAEQHLSKLILGKTVDVKSYGADRNGRTLGEVFLLSGRNVNIEMVQAGLAEVYREKQAVGLSMEPYRQAEEEARKAKRGMWVQGGEYVSPRDWRRKHQS
jgi:endonuclease YncB( thermonuclease family)